MSEFKKTRDVSTSKKIQPPKSLQGEEDAESIWELILNRYPNAAPLLCQMETVIERAEGLLQQLRAPYTHALERSSSFQIADSEDELMGPCHVEESTEVSMASEQDSRLGSIENMTLEIVSVAECSSSDRNSGDYQERKSNLVNSIGDEQSRLLIKTEASVEEQIWSPDLSSSSIYECNSNNLTARESEIKGNLSQEHSPKSPLSSIVNLTGNQIESKKLLEGIGVRKSSSLEAWGKVVGENITESKNLKEKSAGAVNPKEDSVSEHARRLSSLKNGPMHQITKINLLGKKEELMQRFAGTIATASRVVETARMIENTEGQQDAAIRTNVTEVSKDQEMLQSSETNINERGERTSSSEKITKEIEELDGKKEASPEPVNKIREKPELNEIQGNGDEAGIAETGPRSPIEILDEYSKICGIPVEYKNQIPSSSWNKNVIVKCCFGGFAFEASAQGKKIGKRDAAGKILRCLAGRQIDGENMAELTPFSRKQIREIISLGNGGEHETAVRKLYKICMELDAPEPTYTVHRDSGIVGNRYTVKCAALGITTSGYGIRILLAKRVAADKLLQNYYETRTFAN